ncbi:Blue-light-activated protein [Synechococcus sp. MIT S9509]|uniref:hybrid sensor histidine kinase/response regulator n=1 Tax=unclassified Synechococcus TaxID=2626047 RepID=UPI0007BC3BA8|nr:MULTISPECIES: PAS domain-containing sensor histidine kinase [unclassified Synechococcus]KZR85133.1 Blue-light-activated protein [Synechococcus sp. MIT S9504]KZR91334.1 Blue-light-activated protein [Synechococcus sp. MIT S9509]
MDRYQVPDAAAIAQSRLIERLAESERTMRDILVNLPVIVARFNKNNKGKIQFLNMAWSRILGFKIDSCIGMEINSFILAEDLQRWNELLEQSHNDKGKSSDLDSQIRFKDSKEQIRWLRIKLDQRKNGEVIALMEDFTERRRLDAELIQAQRLESIGHLAGGLAHDFNNLLQVIMGYINLTQRLINKKGIDSNYLETAKQACLRAAGLSKQMLTFSKGGEPVQKPGSLEKVVREAVDMSLHGSKLKASIKLEQDIPEVNMDYGQIHQVLHNVILNAEQATAEGGLLDITIRRALPIDSNPSPKEMVVVEIKDKGIGIEVTNLGKIYDPYFTTKKTGNGLGLTSAYWIIKKHNGNLQINSEYGKGTTVQISLPALHRSEASDKSQSRKSKQTTSMSILIMDDEEIVRKSMQLMLEDCGHHVTSVKHGEECLQAYSKGLEEKKYFDIIILDLTISGGKGGIWTIEQILKLNPSARAIAASGYSHDNTLSNYKQIGFYAVLQKPFGIDTLNKCLEDVINM